MRELAADLLVGRLVDWGVDTVFGRPGPDDGGVLAAFARFAGRIRLVVVRHEEVAALMASGYAKTTGRVGICLATSGPGALHLLAGLYDAKLDHQPVLAVTESSATELLGTSFAQRLAVDAAYGDVADYNVRVDVPVQIPAVVDIGIGQALAKGTVSHITLPDDLDETTIAANPWMLRSGAGTPATAPLFQPGPGVPPRRDLERAAAVLNRGARVAVLAGAGALGAREELLAVAERLASPIVKSLPGKAVVPDDHPLTTGCVGALGTRPSEEALAGADTLLVVGTNFPYARNLPDPDAVRTVQVESDLDRVRAADADAALVGDAAETLDALLPLLGRKPDRDFLASTQAGVARWRARLVELEDGGRDPVRPQYLLRTLDRLAAGDAVLAADSGTVATWAARHFDVRDHRQFLLSANLATAAAGLPYAMAAQWASRGRQTIAVVGSDEFATLMAELRTAVGLGLPVKVVVCNTGPPPAEAGGLPAADYARWARACGGLGVRVERAAELEAGLREALAAEGTALVDVLVDPHEQPRPAVAGGA
ncbi:MAG TPA: thiamine pyrophosphate-binding protein [Actinomycetes bacterium]|nr:thiamine pyrophosphate-binding protein [Actinomycetes bacterium]